MENQVPASNQVQPPEEMPQPPVPQTQGPTGLDPQMVELMKARAREEAIRMTAAAQRQEQPRRSTRWRGQWSTPMLNQWFQPCPEI